MAFLLPLSIDAKFPLHPRDLRPRAFLPQQSCSARPLGPKNLDHTSDFQISHSLTMKKSKGAYVSGCISAENHECAMTKDDVFVERRLANFPPERWGDRFDNFTLEDHSKMERYAKQSEPLKEEVRVMLLDDSSDNLGMKINLIDTIERLGIPYFYQDEIDGLLDRIFKQLSKTNFNMNYDLYDTAVQFRIFRQHGYNLPCDVFNKFIDGEGKFKEALKSDERGMTSLYEATHLRVHGEDILEKAFVFTTDFLESIACNSEQAKQALEQPLHRGNPRVQTKKFIYSYMEDESRNEILVQLAKIEFNRLQLIYCQELSQIQKWWKDFDFVNKVPYMRHRSVENHFSAIIMSYLPQFSFARMICSRIFILMNVLDDTCDSYATFNEIQQLADAIERWDLHSTEQFTVDYLKVVYTCVTNTCEDLAKELTKSGKTYVGHYPKEVMQQLMRNYLIEAKWLNKKHQPTFEEYMDVRRTLIGIRQGVAGILLGMEEINKVKPLEQVLQVPSRAQIASESSGILGDIFTGEAEIARGSRDFTSIECYMKDYKMMSREEVLEVFENMMEDFWKDINNERLLIKKSDLSSKLVYELLLNGFRATTVIYRVGDGFGSPDQGSIEEDIIATYTKPFSV